MTGSSRPPSPVADFIQQETFLHIVATYFENGNTSGLKAEVSVGVRGGVSACSPWRLNWIINRAKWQRPSRSLNPALSRKWQMQGPLLSILNQRSITIETGDRGGGRWKWGEGRAAGQTFEITGASARGHWTDGRVTG